MQLKHLYPWHKTLCFLPKNQDNPLETESRFKRIHCNCNQKTSNFMPSPFFFFEDVCLSIFKKSLPWEHISDVEGVSFTLQLLKKIVATFLYHQLTNIFSFILHFITDSPTKRQDHG